MTERSIPAAGDEPFVRRGETSHPAAEAAFIPEPVYARREARKRKGVPPALYVAPVVGVALLGGLALMTGSGTPQTAAPEAAQQAELTSQAAPTALAANTLAAPETEIATPAVEPAPEAAVEPAPAARRAGRAERARLRRRRRRGTARGAHPLLGRGPVERAGPDDQHDAARHPFGPDGAERGRRPGGRTRADDLLTGAFAADAGKARATTPGPSSFRHVRPDDAGPRL